VLDPIPPGLDKDEFFERLKDAIETATARLLEEGDASLSFRGAGASPRARNP
jgi:1-acyl-sn-glycerol-3-phosphate acyltransferase